MHRHLANYKYQNGYIFPILRFSGILVFNMTTTEIPQDVAKLVLHRKSTMRNSSVAIDGNGEIISNTNVKEIPDTYKVVVRKSGRSGPAEASERAKALRECKGLKKCEFAKCALNAFGKLPPNIKKSCPDLKDEIVEKNNL